MSPTGPSNENTGLWPRALRQLSEMLSSLTGRPTAANLPPVFVAATHWTVNGVNVFSANLVRGLNRLGGDARVLITEEDSDLVRLNERFMPRAGDIPFESLGCARSDSWGAHWGRMIRFLADRAPCIYIPNSDWRHSCVCPRLPAGVTVVGIVHSDDPLHYNHVTRLGHTWNAAVAVSQSVAQRTAELNPSIAARLTTIPIGARIPRRLPGRRGPSDRLRLIYHGILKQHQKRVLDLPRILHAALDRGVPAELTIVGGGPDEHALRTAAAPLVDRGAIRFLGVVAPDDVGPLLAQHDVYLLASEFEGLPNALIEAMGQACVPLVTRMTSGVPEVIRDGENGFLVPIGDIEAFADRLQILWRQVDLRRRLSKQAFRTVSARRYRVEQMVASYADVFARAHADDVAGRFIRPTGELSHPPADVAGVSLFPLALTHHEPGVGWFPTDDDARDYERELTMPHDVAEAAHQEAPIDGMPVLIACPVWIESGVSRWAEDLARGLRAAGLDARLLLTEEGTALVTIPEARLNRPDDVPCETLPLAGPDDGWGARWGAMLRLLERSAPCIYIPHFDWRHSCVTPLASKDVMVFGIVHSGEPLYVEHAHRLGRSWNGVIATNRQALDSLRRLVPELADRGAAIPHGLALQLEAIHGAPAKGEGPVAMLVDTSRVHDFEQLAARLRTAGLTCVAVLAGDAAASGDVLRNCGADTLVRPNRQEWLRLCADAVACVAVVASPDAERLLVEAMSHGAVPVVLAADASDGAAGRADAHLPSPTTVDAAVDWLTRLASDTELRGAHASRARAAAADGRYAIDQMVASFIQVFRRARSRVDRGVLPERWGRIEPPPAAIDGMDILPVPMVHETERGVFPSEFDAKRFEEEASGVRADQPAEPASEEPTPPADT